MKNGSASSELLGSHCSIIDITSVFWRSRHLKGDIETEYLERQTKGSQLLILESGLFYFHADVVSTVRDKKD